MFVFQRLSLARDQRHRYFALHDARLNSVQALAIIHLLSRLPEIVFPDCLPSECGVRIIHGFFIVC
jgi:hypothetical protein